MRQKITYRGKGELIALFTECKNVSEKHEAF